MKLVLRTLNDMYPTIQRDLKDSVSLMKAAVWDGDWSVSNDILR